MTDEIPDLPGYVSTKEAAKMLGISERRIRFYIEAKRLPGGYPPLRILNS